MRKASNADTKIFPTLPSTADTFMGAKSVRSKVDLPLRNKAGIDTLDADAASLEQANHVEVDAFEALRVRGFLRDGVSFGGATAFKAKISHAETAIDCAILIPDLTRHVDVVEVISGPFLRERLGIEDGDDVTLHVGDN